MDFFTFQTGHTSVRSFEEKPIAEELKQQLIIAAQSGSSSSFVQAYSIIELQDREKINEIAQLSGGEYFIPKAGAFYIFVADLHRDYLIAKETNDNFEAFASMESLLVGIVDATIAAQNMALFAESQGLGICYIGGIRNDIFRVAQLLNLPSHTVPLFGLTVGYPSKKNEVKPRLPQQVVLHIDSYQDNPDSIKEYDQTMSDYYSSRGSSAQNSSWRVKIQERFAKNTRQEVAQFLKQQGFNCS
ncbi:MAG: oxygen-insensitive NADPH nitroreductase [Micrococcaceae bacterium]